MHRILLLVFVTFCLFSGCEDDKPAVVPFTVSVIDVSMSSATVTWSSGNEADHYAVYLEAELIEDNIQSDSFTLTNLNGDITYSGYVIAINDAGQQQIAPFSFETTAQIPDTRPYTLPTRASLFYQYGGPTNYYDSIWYSYEYLADGNVSEISRLFRTDIGGYRHELNERFEFNYLNRRLVINEIENDSDKLIRSMTFTFNNEHYVLPEKVVIDHFITYNFIYEPDYDSIIFSYTKNNFLDSVMYFGTYDHVAYVYNEQDDRFFNSELSFTDLTAPFQQYNGLEFPGKHRMGENPLMYGFRMFKSAPTLVNKFTKGESVHEYLFENEKLKSIKFSDYSWDAENIKLVFEY